MRSRVVRLSSEVLVAVLVALLVAVLVKLVLRELLPVEELVSQALLGSAEEVDGEEGRRSDCSSSSLARSGRLSLACAVGSCPSVHTRRS